MQPAPKLMALFMPIVSLLIVQLIAVANVPGASAEGTPTGTEQSTANGETERVETQKIEKGSQAFHSYTKQGTAYFQLRHYLEAEKFFRLAYDQGVKENNIKEQCLSLNNIATVKVESGKYSEAEAYCLKILQIGQTEELGDQLTRSRVRVNLADLYGKEKQYEKAQALFKQILQECPRTREGELTAINVLGTMGLMMYNKGSAAEALTCYQQAIDRCNKLNPVPEAALEQNLNNLAPIYVSMNKPQLAFEVSSKALPLAKKLFGAYGNSTIVAYNNLGTAMLLLEHYSAAQEIFKQSLAAIGKSPDVKVSTKIECINDLGCVCLKMHQWKEALEYLRAACGLALKAGPSQSVMLTQSLINLGTAYNNAGDEEAAAETFKKAIATAAQTGNPTSKMKAQKYYDGFLQEHHRTQ